MGKERRRGSLSQHGNAAGPRPSGRAPLRSRRGAHSHKAQCLQGDEAPQRRSDVARAVVADLVGAEGRRQPRAGGAGVGMGRDGDGIHEERRAEWREMWRRGRKEGVIVGK